MLALALLPQAGARELNLSAIETYAGPPEPDAASRTSGERRLSASDEQALTRLIERSGCAARLPDGPGRDGRALTRFEAAAVLNVCLPQIAAVSDDLRPLIRAFEPELAILRGRADGLDARLGELEASRFSTTTVLNASTSGVLGAVSASGDDPRGRLDSALPAGSVPSELFPALGASAYNAEEGALVFSTDLSITQTTSFSGRDRLLFRMHANNFNNAFNGRGLPGRLTNLVVSDDTEGVVKVNRLHYTVPLNDTLTAYVGARARNTESIALIPSVYGKNGERILDFFGGVWGAPAVYNKATGALIGLSWEQPVTAGQPGWSLSANVVTPSNRASRGESGSGGVLSENAAASLLAQLAYGGSRWGIAAGYRHGQCESSFRTGTDFAAANSFWQDCRTITDLAIAADGTVQALQREGRSGARSNSVALNAYWQPERAGWIPSVSAGWALASLSGRQLDLQEDR
ncbi:iron uptake porin [Synechococcus sp. RSCCF101]|uniref:iron uptake porin n=1 Tax=Synechococcus sp. RSCCF101 TaxID=2511069 RepID=UPI00177FDBD7